MAKALSSKQQVLNGWQNVHLVLQHTDRSLLAEAVSEVLEALSLWEWRENWIFENDVWQVTVNRIGFNDGGAGLNA